MSVLDRKNDETSSTSTTTKDDHGPRALNIITLIIATLALLLVFFNPLAKKPDTFIDPLKATVDSLRADNVQIHHELDYMKAHTDSTGLADMRHELNEWRGNAEELSSTAIRLTEAYDRAFLQGGTPRK